MSHNDIGVPTEVHLHQFRFNYYDNGTVVQLLQREAREISDNKVLARVYAANIRRMQKNGTIIPDLQWFNGYWYAQRHGLTFNIDNGNIVSNPQITDLFK